MQSLRMRTNPESYEIYMCRVRIAPRVINVLNDR